MNLLDANILLYAYNRASEQHQAARRWLEDALAGAVPVAFCWPTILAFLRIATSPRALSRPLSVAEARRIVDSWLAVPIAAVVQPTDRHWEILVRLLAVGQASGPLVSDAHLAALAIEHGATLVTNDRDFSRFSGLRVEYPLLKA
ncbi:MAG: type II toxin-antitoxin system VapC family toxin [Deltaproteobacteria bacterium]|nr:type II toxin-antitoxin system VapC family toxin [Deltaproteobacteria bacterium]